MKVVALPRVLEYMENLVPVLYEKGYFSYREHARKYVDELYADIETNLPKRPKRKAPDYFLRYGKGMYYVRFKKNRNTTWYVFFRMYLKNGEFVYQLRYIGNNHTDAHHL
jgi:hypothetical protein